MTIHRFNSHEQTAGAAAQPVSLQVSPRQVTCPVGSNVHSSIGAWVMTPSALTHKRDYAADHPQTHQNHHYKQKYNIARMHQAGTGGSSQDALYSPAT
jgi:hypothetical protein